MIPQCSSPLCPLGYWFYAHFWLYCCCFCIWFPQVLGSKNTSATCFSRHCLSLDLECSRLCTVQYAFRTSVPSAAPYSFWGCSAVSDSLTCCFCSLLSFSTTYTMCQNWVLSLLPFSFSLFSSPDYFFFWVCIECTVREQIEDNLPAGQHLSQTCTCAGVAQPDITSVRVVWTVSSLGPWLSSVLSSVLSGCRHCQYLQL